MRRPGSALGRGLGDGVLRLVLLYSLKKKNLVPCATVCNAIVCDDVERKITRLASDTVARNANAKIKHKANCQ